MERWQFGNRELISWHQGRNCGGSHTWTIGLRWGLLLLALFVMAGDDTFAQQGLPSGTKGTPVEFNIPSQPLGAALNAFAEATGWQVSMPTELIAGRTSSGIRGSHQPEEALAALLAGTGMNYRLTDTNAVTLVPGTTVPGAASSLGENNTSSSEPIDESVSTAQQKPIKVP